ncbi:electron transfer flavoprotein subunit beta/FixA family protein [Anaerohalosphaera lusitana]
MDEKTGTVIREGVDSIVNPLDLYAIEAALRLRDRYGGEIVGISMGPKKSVKALKEAVSMGVDSAILLSDRAFAGSDTWATSLILASAIRKIGDFGLVVCGERATDGDTGQVGPGIASFLGIPALTYVSRIQDLSDKLCRAERLIEDGREILETSLPAVLTVIKEAGEPRLPTLRGKKRAKDLDVQIWGNDELGIDPDKIGLKGSPTRVVKIYRPKVARKCTIAEAKDEASVGPAVDRMCGFLADKGVLQ